MTWRLDVDEAISAHMDAQPYGVKCSQCGNDLKCKANTDRDYDLHIEVEPCETCMERADDEGYDRGLKEARSE